MNRARTTARHVVVYCDGCGQDYAEHEHEGIVFDSIAQLLAYIGADLRRAGWVFDGDQVLCDGCTAAQRCEQAGHHGTPSGPDYCHLCGFDIDTINDGENQS